MKRWLRGSAVLVGIFAAMACGPVAPLPPGDVPPATGGRSYVGLPKRAAIARAARSGKRWRVVEEDGRRYQASRDLRPDRLNFTVRRGVVVKVTRG